jgi:threonyl-tRNA synthetase
MANLDEIRHSLAHLLAAAVLKKFPEAKLAIGPTIENGFYYDFALNEVITNSRGKKHKQTQKNFTPEDLIDFEKTMRELIKQHLPFSGRKVTKAEAKKIFKGQPFKLELIEEFSNNKKPLTIYITGKLNPRESAFSPRQSAFIDLCRGGHVKNTSEINPDAFKLTHIAGAYWRGDENKPMLQRIYGVAFETKKDLEDYLKIQEEAKKRDHKRLGPELDLFTFSDLVGSGLPLWTPKGALLRNLLDDFVWQLRKARGYERVEIPHITKKDLYEKSGHWTKFKDELFKITTREGHIFAMKPMNCPHHTQIYARRQWSYRELPQRYANTTMCYRDEQTGELSGLSRARSFTQDDAHVFCRMSQAKEEFLKIWDIVTEFYSVFGLKLALRISLHDPKQPEKYLGDKKRWAEAENILREVVKLRKAEYSEAIGEAAFYGPKLDFLATDSLRRKWQVATIQLDMNMPERFDLACTNERGEKERIVMIHAAIMGSIERFLSIIIEHFGGEFPLWLSPIQVKVIPVSEKFEVYAKKIHELLLKNGIRSEIDATSDTLGKRIRQAELQKIPYSIVVGKKELATKTVNVRELHKKETNVVPIEEFLELAMKKIAEKK